MNLKQTFWQVFSACLVFFNFWGIVNFFWDLPGLLLRGSIWLSLTAGANILVIALVESLLCTLLLLLFARLLLRKKAVSFPLHILAVLLLPLFIVYFLPLQLLVKGTDLLYSPAADLKTLLLPIALWSLLFIGLSMFLKRVALRSEKIAPAVRSLLERLSPLAVLNLVLSLSSLILVVIRNLT